jgi:hypothetical protein
VDVGPTFTRNTKGLQISVCNPILRRSRFPHQRIGIRKKIAAGGQGLKPAHYRAHFGRASALPWSFYISAPVERN